MCVWPSGPCRRHSVSVDNRERRRSQHRRSALCPQRRRAHGTDGRTAAGERHVRRTGERKQQRLIETHAHTSPPLAYSITKHSRSGVWKAYLRVWNTTESSQTYRDIHKRDMNTHTHTDRQERVSGVLQHSTLRDRVCHFILNTHKHIQNTDQPSSGLTTLIICAN